ncbi:GGDEF domain-containing protein [Terriglobus tenax]|uniref:GGDEF domain-containing protein n=1 Tax=Terriglobus tenax TaxID=1111115 RepID=UPI0021DF4D78|nr:GGDEF domain-containing protein [Terriglobus tenax]
MNTHNLLLINTLTMLVYAAGLCALHFSYRRARGIWWFMVAFVASGASSALIAGHSLFSRNVHLAGGMLLLTISLWLRHTGFAEYLHVRSRHLWAQAALVGGYAAFLVWSTVLQGNPAIGLQALAFVLAAQTLLSVEVLLRFGVDENRLLRIVTSAVILLVAAFRIVMSMMDSRKEAFGGGNESLAHAQWPLNTLFSAATVFCFVSIFVSQMGLDLREIASTDALTGALNRRALEAQAAREMARCRRYGFPLSVIVMDLDHFKSLNDTHGHNAGDAALCMVVRDLQATLRGTDLLCRSGGEEFLILLPHTDHATALHLAERLRKRVAQVAVPVDNKKIGITASLGVASWSGAGESWTTIVKRADSALYLAKNSGRNRVVTGEEPHTSPEASAQPA